MAIAPNNLTPEEIEAKNEDAYESLLSLIEDTQGQMALIIAACDSMAQREQIIKRYEADAWAEEKVRPFRIRLGQEPSLRAGLAALEEEHPYLKEEGQAVVSVTGAELLLRVKITGEEKQTELEKFYGYLQWTREALRAFKYPVVLWVSREILRELSRRAPDFWSWRKAVLRFEEEIADTEPSSQRNGSVAVYEGEQAFQTQDAASEDEADLPPLEVLLEEIAVLEAREPESYGLATLHHKLGQVYAQRVQRGKATAEAERRKAVEAFQQAIKRYQAQKNGDAAAALNHLSEFYSSQSLWQEGLKAAQVALETAKQTGNISGEMIALRRIGYAHYSLSNFGESIYWYKQSLALAQAIKDSKAEASALGSLGSTYSSLGSFQKAISLHSQSLEIQRAILNEKGIAYCLNHLGIIFYKLGDLSKSISLHSQSLKISESISYQQGIANSLGNAGSILYSLGDFQKSITSYCRAFNIEQKIGDKQGIALSLYGLGLAYDSLGDLNKAVAFHSYALKIAEEIGDRQVEAQAHFNLAVAKVKLDAPLAAKQNFEQARAIFESLKCDHMMVERCDKALYKIN